MLSESVVIIYNIFYNPAMMFVSRLVPIEIVVVERSDNYEINFNKNILISKPSNQKQN